LNVAFDLSQVLFIATANTLSTVPAALLDRMEVIDVPGYTHDDKLHIAVRHLVPKQLTEHGLTSHQLCILDEAIQFISESVFCRARRLTVAPPGSFPPMANLLKSYRTTHTFNGPLSGTTQVSRYQKGKTNLDFTGARDSVWRWHQLGPVVYTPVYAVYQPPGFF